MGYKNYEIKKSINTPFFLFILLFTILALPNRMCSQFWTANFENTTGNNAWITEGTHSGLGSLAANDCYQGGGQDIYYMIRTTGNQCSPAYGVGRYYSPLNGNGSCCLYSVNQSAGVEYLRSYEYLSTTNETMGCVSPQITNTNVTVQLYFTYILGLTANNTCAAYYSIVGNTGPWIQIGSNLTASSTANNFSASFAPGAVNFWLKIEYAIGGSKGQYQGFEFDDVNLTTTACAAPTAQPTSLVFGAKLSTSIAGSFTAASPAANDYLVVRTTTSSAPTNPVNGTTYAPGSSALGGVIVSANASASFTATGLTSNTQYWFWVYSYNSNCASGPTYYTTSPLSGTSTTILGRTWIGKGAGGTNSQTDFNNAAYWSGGVAPGATDEAIINIAGGATISMSASKTVGYLTLYNSDNSGNNDFIFDATTFSLTINNDLNANVNASGTINQSLEMEVGNAGNITILGTANLGTNGNSASYLSFSSSGASSTGTVVFKGDVNFGGTYYPISTGKNLGKFVWDGTGTQTITTSNFWDAKLYSNCQIGSANTPTVILSTAGSNGVSVNGSGNGLTVSAGAVLDLTTNTWNQPGTTGVLTVNGTLKLGGAADGQTGSNFPLGYTGSTPVLATTSTVEYNSASGVNQTVYALPPYGNLTLTNGTGSGTTTKAAGAALTINGITTINSNAVLDGSTFLHNQKGNFVNNGTFTATTSTVSFSGTSGQTISGSSTTTFNNLTINNTNAAGVTLSTPANVSSALVMTAGLLNTTATNILTMQNASTTTVGTSASTSYVNGPMKYQKSVAGSTVLNFPIGKSPDCRPVALTVNHTDGTLFNYTAESFNANPWITFGSGVSDMPATVDTISGVHYVTISRTDNGGTSQPTMGLSGNQTIQMFFGTNDFVYQGSTLTIVKNTSATPATWIDIGGSCALGNFSTPQAGNVSSTSSPTAFNSFSSFALGSKGTGWNSLPVELLEFSAVPNKEKVDLKWSTATETNNAYFAIEKSKDGVNFEWLINVQGAGNSLSLKEYFESDYKPYSGLSYYRLKQTDYNGKYKYSSIVSVTFNGEKNISFFPNPSVKNENLNMAIDGYKNQEILVVLQDMQGRNFYSKVFIAKENNQLFAIDALNTIPAGTYIVVATSKDKVYHQKLIVK